MTTKLTVQASCPPIVEVAFGSGKTGYQVAFQVNGKCIRKSFSTLKDAEKYAAKQRTIYHNEGIAGLMSSSDSCSANNAITE